MTTKTKIHRKSTRTVCKGLSDDELNQVLSLSEKDPLLRDVHDVVVIITGTGLRAGELCDLRWADFELTQRRFNIGSKTAHGRRLVDFGEEVLRIFEAWRQRHPPSAHVLGESPRAVLQRVSRELAALSRTLGIERIFIHSLRLTFCTRMSILARALAH